MTEDAPQAPSKPVTELWHIDFHMAYEPEALAPYYLKAQVSRREPGTAEEPWHIDGIASFDCPPLTPPRESADLLPYLLYHLDEIKQFLMEEHIKGTFQGISNKISGCVAVQQPGLRVVPE